MSTTLPCIVCDQPSETLFADHVPQEPWEAYGTLFKATGNYGSTLFDPPAEDEALLVIVCDECLKRKASGVGYVRKVRVLPRYEKGTLQSYLDERS